MIEGVVKLEGMRPGKTLAVMCGIHGNEICGMQAFDKIVPNLTIEAGTVYFIRANLKAIEQNVRFVDVNMNRIFRSDEQLSSEQKSSYEYQRSRELMPILSTCDVLLDIHSSKNLGSKTFVISDPKHFDIAEKLPFELRAYGWPEFEPGATDEYMDTQGKVGVGIECGYHLDPEATGRAEQSIFAFLKLMGAIPGKTLSYTQTTVRITGLYKTRVDFKLARVFEDFESVKAGELIGTDGGEEVRVDTDGCVIFAHDRDKPSEEAFLTGVYENK